MEFITTTRGARSLIFEGYRNAIDRQGRDDINRILIVRNTGQTVYLCNELIEETAWHRKLILACLLAMAPLSSDLIRKCRFIMEL